MKKFLSVGLLLLFAACAAIIPQTPRERMLAAESAFQAAVGGLQQARDQGLIVTGSPVDENLRRAVATVNGALDRASKLVQAGDMNGALQWLQIAEGGVAELTQNWNTLKKQTLWRPGEGPPPRVLPARFERAAALRLAGAA
jgi:hypothetical protein